MTKQRWHAKILFASKQYCAEQYGGKVRSAMRHLQGERRSGVEKDCGGWISVVFHKLRKRVNADVQSMGLTGIQSRVIHCLLVKRAEGPVYQRDVERTFGISRSTVTGMLQQMEKDGLIRRESVASDARLKSLVPTQKAVHLDAQVEKSLQLAEQCLTRGLSGAQLAAFKEAAAQMAANLDN